MQRTPQLEPSTLGERQSLPRQKYGKQVAGVIILYCDSEQFMVCPQLRMVFLHSSLVRKVFYGLIIVSLWCSILPLSFERLYSSVLQEGEIFVCGYPNKHACELC